MSLCDYEKISLSEDLKEMLANANASLVDEKPTEPLPGFLVYRLTEACANFSSALLEAKVCARITTILFV
jgi:hypothetical protein